MSERRTNRAYLALGSNVEPERNLPAAVRELQRFGRVGAASRVWETEPVGYQDQPNFLNAAVLLETPLSADEILTCVVPQIESSLGRVRDPQNKDAPRTIDVDLVLFNGDVLEPAGRQIPDPATLERAFVALPLCDLDPGYFHPVARRTLSQIAAALAAGAETMRLRPDVVLAPEGPDGRDGNPGKTAIP